MKTNRKKWVLFVALSVVVAVSLAWIAVATLRDPAENEKNSALGEYTEKSKVGMQKTIHIMGETQTATYQYTMNNKKTPQSKRADSYGTYEVYLDEAGTEYHYLYGTERLCGYIQKNTAGKRMTPLYSTDEMQEKCEAFLNEAAANGVAYTFSSIEYAENMALFYVRFAYTIRGIETDDRCLLAVQGDGNIAAYTMYNNGRYTAYADVFWDAEKTDAAFEQAMQKNGKAYELDDRYVSKNDAGELVMVYEVFYPDQNYMDVLQFKLEAVRAA